MKDEDGGDAAECWQPRRVRRRRITDAFDVIKAQAGRSASRPSSCVVVRRAERATTWRTLARLSLEESAARGELLAQAIFQRARQVVAEGGADPYARAARRRGLRSILESSVGYSENVTYAAIVDTRRDRGRARLTRRSKGSRWPSRRTSRRSCAPARSRSCCARLLRTAPSRSAQPLLLGDRQFGSIRIGVSTLLVRSELDAGAAARARHRARRARRLAAVARCCSRSGCCGRST